MAPPAELHARALVVCLCVAAALAAQAPREKILSLKVPYYSAREVTTYSPAAASSAQLPLVLMLSGYCLTASVQEDIQLGYKNLVHDRQFIYVPLKSARSTRVCALCPTTVRAAEAAGNMPLYAAGARLTAAITAAGMCTAWDATQACCITESAGRSGGDTDYIRTVIDTVAAALPVNRQRVYVVGIANGGFLAQRLACDMPGMFAGVVAYASGLDAAQCTATGRTPMLLMHGTADVIVPFAGGINSAGVAFPGFAATARSWVARNDCSDTPAASSFVAAGGPRDGNLTVQVAEYTQNCAARVATWKIINGQHFALAGTSANLFAKALAWIMSRS